MQLGSGSKVFLSPPTALETLTPITVYISYIHVDTPADQLFHPQVYLYRPSHTFQNLPTHVSQSGEPKQSLTNYSAYMPLTLMAPYPRVTTTTRVMRLLGTPRLMKCFTWRYLWPVASSFMIAATEHNSSANIIPWFELGR